VCFKVMIYLINVLGFYKVYLSVVYAVGRCVVVPFNRDDLLLFILGMGCNLWHFFGHLYLTG